jgi:hypothetical protein
VRKKSGKDFSDGAYAGALRDLVAKESGYINPARGKYQKTSGDVVLLEITKEILAEAQAKIVTEVGKLNPIEIKE